MLTGKGVYIQKDPLLVYASSLVSSLYYDNHSASHIAPNSVFHERTENLEIDCDFITVVNSGRA